MYRKIFVLAIGGVLLSTGLVLAQDEERMMYDMRDREMGYSRAAAPGMSSGGMMGMGMMGNGMMGGNMMQRGMSSMGMMSASRWNLIANQLELSDKQRDELTQKSRKINRNMIELNNELSLKRYDLKYELEKVDIDESSIGKLINDITDIQKSLLTLRKDNLLKFKDVLTNDQWESFQKMRNGSMGMGNYNGMHR